MKFKNFSNYESNFVPEFNDGTSIVDSSCYIPQAVKIQNLLAAGQSLIELMPPAGEYEQHGSVDESLVDTLSDYADLAEVDSLLKQKASSVLSEVDKQATKSSESVAQKSEPASGSQGAGSGAAKAASEAPAVEGV